MFLGKDVLKTCSKFTGEHPCWSVISITYLVPKGCAYPRLLLTNRNFKRHFCQLHDSITILTFLPPKVAETKTRKRRRLMEILLKCCPTCEKPLKNGPRKHSLAFNWIFLKQSPGGVLLKGVFKNLAEFRIKHVLESLLQASGLQLY